MPRRPTIRDVALRAGVHQSTASRALNPALEGRVTAATTRRVRAAARELGYSPNPVARSLRTRRSGLVGVVVPDLTNPVIPPIVRGIENSLWAAGIACLLADTDNVAERETALIDELRARHCDGLIVSTATLASETVAGLAGGELPVVLVTREIEARSLPFVGADEATGVAAAVEHLAALGHERIAHLTGPPELSTTATRMQAFIATSQRLGLAEPRALIRHGDAFTIPAGRRLAAELLAEHNGVTAILAGNDMIALGCYEALEQAGRQCPREISIVGHNDMPLVQSVRPPLTTVAIPQYEIGRRAAALLLERLGGGSRAASRDLLATKLVVRESTGPADGRAGRGER